jgi:hypothetical protein
LPIQPSFRPYTVWCVSTVLDTLVLITVCTVYLNCKQGSRRVQPVDRWWLILLVTWSHLWYIQTLTFHLTSLPIGQVSSNFQESATHFGISKLLILLLDNQINTTVGRSITRNMKNVRNILECYTCNTSMKIAGAQLRYIWKIHKILYKICTFVLDIISWVITST